MTTIRPGNLTILVPVHLTAADDVVGAAASIHSLQHLKGARKPDLYYNLRV